MKKQNARLYLFLIIIAAYLGIVFAYSPTRHILDRYHLSALQYNLLVLTIVLPLIAIWLIGYYGYIKMHNYSDTLPKNQEGRAVARLTNGVCLLVFQLPVSTLTATLMSRIALSHPGFTAASTIISHYVGLILPLMAFVFISYGSRGLTESVKQRPSQRATYILGLAFIIIGAGFTYFVFRHGNVTSGASAALVETDFFLPNWLLFFTIVVPYIFMWFIGVLAAYEIYLFQQKVSGILFRRSWELLAAGLAWVILVSITLQYLTTLSNHLARLTTTGLLFVIYAILVILAAGFLLIAAGANKLKRIEDV